MAKITVKAKVDGQDKDAELDDEQLPDGLLSKGQHDTRMRTESENQFKRGERSALKKVLDDEETRTKVIGDLTEAGHIDTKGGGKGKPSAEEVEAIRADLRKREVEPLKVELDGLKKDTERSRLLQLRSQLLAAGKQAGVHDHLLEGDIADDENLPAFVVWHERRFGYDAERTKGFAVKKGDGFEYAKTASDKQPWKTANEFVGDWASDPKNKSFLKPQGQRGPNLGNPNLGGGGDDLSKLSPEERLNAARRAEGAGTGTTTR